MMRPITLQAIGDVSWTPWALLLLAALALIADGAGWDAGPLVAVPLGLLALNLLVALLVRRRFRRDRPLLALHLALLTLVVLTLIGVLGRAESRVALVEGSGFTGLAETVTQGVFYPGDLAHLRFANEGLLRSYRPDGRLFQIRNRSRWSDQGRDYRGVISRDRPLLLDGYRVYPTGNWGHAPFLLWQGVDGAAGQSALPLGPWFRGAEQQGMEWTPPASDRALWVGLDFGDPLDPVHRGDLPADAPDQASLVVRLGEQRWTLKAGQSLAIPGLGRLAYQRLGTWMGYRITYDPVDTALLAGTLLLVMGMVWYYVRKLRNSSWIRNEQVRTT